MLRDQLRRAVPAAALLLLTACGGPLEPGPETEPGIQTQGQVFTIESEPVHGFGVHYEVEIPYTFTNRTGRTVFISHCHGGSNRSLERKQGGNWVYAGGGGRLDCLSLPPITILPGEQFSETYRVVGFDTDFDARAGTYRVRWGDDVLFEFDQNEPGLGTVIPLDHRLSNEFDLTF